MPRFPAVVAFDVIETLFSLSSLEPRLEAAGLPADRLETWFGRLLRDAFALDATGVYRPFRDVAAASLAPLLWEARADPGGSDAVLAGFAELDVQPDAEPAIRTLEDAGVRVVVLTNGAAAATESLLERAGLRGRVERIVTAAEVGRWKPRREVYLHCAAAVGVDPGRLGLVAAHAWDVHGAKRAGLVTGFVARHGPTFPDVMDAPDVTGATLVEVAKGLLGRE